jgi:hypothetical protein
VALPLVVGERVLDVDVLELEHADVGVVDADVERVEMQPVVLSATIVASP